MAMLMGTAAISQAQEQKQAWRKILVDCDYAEIAMVYADYMMEHGRDRYGIVTPDTILRWHRELVAQK